MASSLHAQSSQLIDQYALDVYNYDETGLNWRQPPDRTLATSKSAGGKKKKERITIGLACNATGTDKLKPVIVGKSARPRAWKKWNEETDDDDDEEVVEAPIITASTA